MERNKLGVFTLNKHQESVEISTISMKSDKFPISIHTISMKVISPQ